MWDVELIRIPYQKLLKSKFFVFICLPIVLRPVRNISFIWRRHKYRWRTTKLRPMLALMPFEQGGIFIAPDLLRHGAAIFAVISNGPPQFRRLYDQQRVPKMFCARNTAIIVYYMVYTMEWICMFYKCTLSFYSLLNINHPLAMRCKNILILIGHV